MGAATRYYELMGYRVEDRSSNSSFDLACYKGEKCLWVEVKGTQTVGDEIILTRNEVSLTQSDEQRMALFIQYGVTLAREGEAVVASGGRSRIIDPWRPTPDDLTPITYRCKVR